MPLIFDMYHEKKVTQAQVDYLFEKGLIQGIDVDYLISIGEIEKEEDAEYSIQADDSSDESWANILIALDDHDNLACPKCGWDYTVHNDDGSCVEED